MENCKTKLNNLFEKNLNKATDIRMVWDVIIIFMMGHFIQHNKKQKKWDNTENFRVDKNER